MSRVAGLIGVFATGVKSQFTVAVSSRIVTRLLSEVQMFDSEKCSNNVESYFHAKVVYNGCPKKFFSGPVIKHLTHKEKQDLSTVERMKFLLALK